jgi:hypothetical protein
MKAPDFTFRLDWHRRFLSRPSLSLDRILWADHPASDCADRPWSGQDFAFPATSSVNHWRGDPRARASGIPLKGKQSDSVSAMARRIKAIGNRPLEQAA